MAPSDTSHTVQRRAAIHIRATAFEQDLIDRAAEVLGKTRSEFMLESARAAAEDVLFDRVEFPLTADEFRQFEELLDSAPEPNESLRRFVRQRPPWERER